MSLLIHLIALLPRSISTRSPASSRTIALGRLLLLLVCLRLPLSSHGLERRLLAEQQQVRSDEAMGPGSRDGSVGYPEAEVSIRPLTVPSRSRDSPMREYDSILVYCFDFRISTTHPYLEATAEMGPSPFPCSSSSSSSRLPAEPAW